MSDADRALVGQKRRRTPQGVPVGPYESWDEDATPPPHEIPFPWGASIDDKFEALAEGINRVSTAVGRVWDARKDGEWRERIDEKLGTLASATTRLETILDQYIKPQLDHWRATTDGIARDLPRIAAAVEGMELAFRAVENRLRSLEADMVRASTRQEAAHASIVARVEACEARDSAHETRIARLERDRRDEQVKATALAKIERRKTSIGAALVAFASGIASSFIK